MKASFYPFLFALFLTLLPISAPAQEAGKPDERGAVLCAWMIYASLQQVGDSCDVEKADRFQPVLDDAVKRIENFIHRNSDITEEQLTAQRKKLFLGAENICTGEMPRYYAHLANIDPKRFTDSIDKLLEVDRPPVMNPCL